MKKITKYFLDLLGYSITKNNSVSITTEELHFPSDISDEAKKIFVDSLGYTMISIERLEAIVQSIDYICRNQIDGDIVECGVWRGGAMYAAAKALVARNCVDKKIFLFDVFEVEALYSTTNETIFDKNYLGKTVSESVSTGLHNKENYNYEIDEVKKLLLSTGYPEDKIIFKVGRVEETLPASEIEKISLLRLDTDWYESTKHELEHLYPQLVKQGVLLIDDYGYWQGCRQAVDEYFRENNLQLLLHRTDYTGRSAVKF